MISIGDDGYYKNQECRVIDIHHCFPVLLIRIDNREQWIHKRNFEFQKI